MDGLKAEWERLVANDYRLTFTYPTDAEKLELRLINVDPVPRSKRRGPKVERQSIDNVLDAVRRGDIDSEKLIAQIRNADNAKHKQ